MRRNWDIIRELLLAVEALPTSGSELHARELPGRDESLTTYQMRLLIEAGFLEGEIHQAIGTAPRGTAYRLTWQGHELLDSLRSLPLWNRIKERLQESGVEMTLAAVLKVGRQVVDQCLGQ